MRQARLISAAVSIATILPVSLTAPAPEANTLTTSPPCSAPQHPSSRWLCEPSREEFLAVYPSSLACKPVMGDALVRCHVERDGRLSKCVVPKSWSSDPDIFDAGDAALKLAVFYRVSPTSPEGKSTITAGTVQWLGHFPGAHCDPISVVRVR